MCTATSPLPPSALRSTARSVDTPPPTPTSHTLALSFARPSYSTNMDTSSVPTSTTDTLDEAAVRRSSPPYWAATRAGSGDRSHRRRVSASRPRIDRPCACRRMVMAVPPAMTRTQAASTRSLPSGSTVSALVVRGMPKVASPREAAAKMRMRSVSTSQVSPVRGTGSTLTKRTSAGASGTSNARDSVADSTGAPRSSERTHTCRPHSLTAQLVREVGPRLAVRQADEEADGRGRRARKRRPVSSSPPASATTPPSSPPGTSSPSTTLGTTATATAFTSTGRTSDDACRQTRYPTATARAQPRCAAARRSRSRSRSPPWRAARAASAAVSASDAGTASASSDASRPCEGARGSTAMTDAAYSSTSVVDADAVRLDSSSASESNVARVAPSSVAKTARAHARRGAPLLLATPACASLSVLSVSSSSAAAAAAAPLPIQPAPLDLVSSSCSSSTAWST
mmetsp:Transcript_12550/g.39655  ORF Transcript_12550/g.39655 Transcript_12550/m.39655 type:complete len:456 (+) Transcript_12550:1432-2799(+)